MSAEVHVGDIGTEFRAQVRDETGGTVDVSAAAVRKLKFLKPDGALLVVDAQPGCTDVAKTAALGWMSYLSVAGDLNAEGEWIQQGYVEVGGKWHSDEFRFTVHRVLS